MIHIYDSAGKYVELLFSTRRWTFFNVSHNISPVYVLSYARTSKILNVRFVILIALFIYVCEIEALCL